MYSVSEFTKKPSLVWGIKNPYEWILVKYEAKHPQRTKKLYYVQSDLEL